jgi:hypothetical protein
MEELLREILAELKRQHAYTVERDLRLDAEDAEDRERKTRNDELMRQSIEMQQRGLRVAEGMADKVTADPLKRYEMPSNEGPKQ